MESILLHWQPLFYYKPSEQQKNQVKKLERAKVRSAIQVVVKSFK